MLESDIRSLRSEIETSQPFKSGLENGHGHASRAGGNDSAYSSGYDYAPTNSSAVRNGYESSHSVERRRDRSLSRERSPADYSNSLSLGADYKPSAKSATVSYQY